MTWSSDAETTRIPSATETSGGTGPQPTREYVWPEPVTGRQPTVEPVAPAVAASPSALGPVEAEPEPVRRSGNRLAGLALALLTTAVFAVLYLVALTAIRLLVDRVGGDPVALALDAAPTALFLAPVAAFLVGLALIVLVVNRAGWWAYVLGGFLVALLTAAAALVGGWSAVGPLALPIDRSLALDYVRDPAVLAAVLAAGVLGREASVWGGAAIAGRARGVKRRNAEREAAAQS
ncbi:MULTISPECIES: hypothetical protein [unclassified Rathayibacter]|uniref:hypothetical protein n=1 Tax=unclassified Rathayibacter TaxID=2609250 RepID=UPI000CE92B06|nr:MULTISPECIES: hypothetical protein [unclassified Rathayibacter]PPG09986.1 hypothetical protein C5C26_05040 [Rathayibacter sp. AY2B1]PPG68115.1 hypothetical protein C5C59_13385 [Rathayibacter sp. AY1F4]